MKNKILIYPLIFIIKIYQFIFSPLIGKNCRYIPTCSEYAVESLKLHGLLRGSFFAIKRILKCHPYGGHGFDPIPNRKKNKVL